MTDIKQQTAGRWHGILTGIGIDASFLRAKQGPCPMCGGNDRFRYDDKDGRGTWYCNHCGAGDGFALVMKIKGCDFKSAKALIEPLAGVVKMQTRKSGKQGDARRIESIRAGCVRASQGDDVARYLFGRGLEVPPGIGFNRGVTFYDGPTLVGKFAAMVGSIRDLTGDVKGLHVTYLQDGQKAPVDPARKMYSIEQGSTTGCAIQLYRCGDTLAVSEGIETGIAFKMLTGYPVWATTSATLLSRFLPPPQVSNLIIAADNDANYVGQHHAYALADLMTRKGLNVTVRLPPNVGQDWCDVWQAYSK